MAVLSILFWFTSWPYIPFFSDALKNWSVNEDFPNCISARVDTSLVAAGHLSHHGISSFFVTAEGLEPGQAIWIERADGHFCGFEIPPYLFGGQPDGFGVHVTAQTFGWDCPYWLMATLWIALFWKTRGRIRFRVVELLLAIVVVTIAVTLIRLESAMICTFLINFSTLLMLSYLGFVSLAILLYVKNPWWLFGLS